jgi:flagellar biosynthetic protein FliR
MIEIPLLTIITKLLTIGVRLSGLMLFAPFFGSVVIPVRVKAVLVFVLTLMLYPTVGKTIDPRVVTNWPWMIIIEFLVGAGMGIATNVVFEAVQLTGQVLGVQMGYSLVNILDPQTQVDTTVMATFYQCIVMLLFLRMDVHYWLLRAVGNSYHDVPPGTAHISNLFTLSIVSTIGDIFGLGIQIAAPVLSATLAADIILGPSADAADVAGTCSEELARGRSSDCDAEVLARLIPPLIYGRDNKRRAHISFGRLRING